MRNVAYECGDFDDWWVEMHRMHNWGVFYAYGIDQVYYAENNDNGSEKNLSWI